MNNMKKIWAISKSLSMSSDDLHTLCYAVTGCESLKELTAAQSTALIGELRERQKLAGVTYKPKKTYKTSGMTQEQCGKAFALIYDLAAYDKTPSSAAAAERLCGVIRKALGKLSETKEPFARLDSKDGIMLIETLNRYIYSAQRKAAKKC
jgi:hypothetical protein